MQSNGFQIEGLTPNDDETVNSRKKNRYVTRPKITVENNETVIPATRKSSGCKNCNKKK